MDCHDFFLEIFVQKGTNDLNSILGVGFLVPEAKVDAFSIIVNQNTITGPSLCCFDVLLALLLHIRAGEVEIWMDWGPFSVCLKSFFQLELQHTGLVGLDLGKLVSVHGIS
jgi:hypothetical protein